LIRYFQQNLLRTKCFCALTKSPEINALVNRGRDGRVHQLVREAMDCATTGAKQVRHRGFDKGICAVACAKRGSSSKHLTFGSFCQEKEQSPAGKAMMIKAPKFK